MFDQSLLLTTPDEPQVFKLGQNVVSLNLIGKKYVQIEIQMPRQLKILSGKYGFDALPLQLRRQFSSMQKFTQFIKGNPSQRIKMIPNGIKIWLNEFSQECIMRLQQRSMSQKQIRKTVLRLLQENRTLNSKLVQQTKNMHEMLDSLMNDKEKSEEKREVKGRVEDQEKDEQKAFFRVEKRKVIHKDREEKGLMRYKGEVRESKVNKRCEMCRRTFLGPQHFYLCKNCYYNGRD